MLYTKFQSNWPSSSGEDFSRFLPYMGLAAISVKCPEPFELLFLHCQEAVYGILFKSAKPFQRRRYLKMVDGWTTMDDEA